VVNLYIAAF